MKLRLLSLIMLLLAMTMQATAARYYKIKVAGVEVNSDNASNITSSRISVHNGSINGGKYSVTYSGDENGGTLTLYNVRIERDGKDNRAVLNDGNPNLTIVLKGPNYLRAEDSSPVRLNGKTTIKSEPADGYRYNVTNIIGGSEDAFTVGSGAEVTITDSHLSLESESSCFDASGSPKLTITNSVITATCKKYKSGDCYALRDYQRLTVNNSTVTLNGYDQAIRDLDAISLGEGMNIAQPAYGRFDSSSKTITNDWGKVAASVELSMGLALNSSNFPDNNFLLYVKDLDPNTNGVLTDAEIAEVTEIDVQGKNISSLRGIEFFTALTKLNCSHNNLSQLNLSKNTKLTYVDCCVNSIDTERFYLMVTGLPTLKKYVGGTLITNDNAVPTQLANEKGWQVKSEYGDAIGGVLVAPQNFPDQQFRNCVEKEFDKDEDYLLDTNELLNATRLDAQGYMYLRDFTGLRYLYYLKYLNIRGKFAGAIDVSKNKWLEELNCESNDLTSLDVTKNTKLKKLICNYNTELTSLDISKNEELEVLELSDCNLTSLNVSYKHHNLKTLHVDRNRLERLDLTYNPIKGKLYIFDNCINADEMLKLFDSLNEVDPETDGECTIYCIDKDSKSELNVCTREAVRMAKRKGWKVKKFENHEWKDFYLRGDVNGDGAVDVADIATVISIMSSTVDVLGDVNEDGSVDVADIATIITEMAQ
ncbi:MAG: hypothetical protein J6W19_08375 [Prevotella sp.]|nr:hypothetical protein [Prevotella sp.]